MAQPMQKHLRSGIPNFWGHITYDLRETGSSQVSSHAEDAVATQGWFVVFSYILSTAIFPRFSAFLYEDDLQDGDTFGFLSTRFAQTINFVYCCPDQETGEVLASDDWMRQTHLRTRYSYPGSPSGIFPRGSPTSESNSRISSGSLPLKFLY